MKGKENWYDYGLPLFVMCLMLCYALAIVMTSGYIMKLCLSSMLMARISLGATVVMMIICALAFRIARIKFKQDTTGVVKCSGLVFVGATCIGVLFLFVFIMSKIV